MTGGRAASLVSFSCLSLLIRPVTIRYMKLRCAVRKLRWGWCQAASLSHKTTARFKQSWDDVLCQDLCPHGRSGQQHGGQFLSQKVLLTSTASPLPFSSPELPPLQTGFEHGLCQSQQHCRENCSIALEPLITAMLRHSFKSCRNGIGIMQTEMRTHSNQSRVKH